MKETKKCTNCGRELPVSEFYKSKVSADGLKYQCKDCCKEYARDYASSRRKAKVEASGVVVPSAPKSKSGVPMSKVFMNPELAKFQPRELIAELRARGYSGELSITMKIKV